MEKIKGAIEKARLQNHNKPVDIVKTHERVSLTSPKAADTQLSEQEFDIDLINYQQTKVVKLDLNHLAKNRILAFDEEDVRSWIFDSLRTQVIQKMEENHWRTLAVISPTPECGKTLVSINLAISISQQPQKTAMLVDFDLRRPRVASYLGIKTEKSINEFLQNNASLQEIMVNPDTPRLVILPTNRPVAKSSEMLASAKVSNLIKELRDRYDSRIIIVDLPPILNSDDAMVILNQVDCALMVIGNGLVTESEINESMRLLSKTNLLGIVINKAEDVTVRNYY